MSTSTPMSGMSLRKGSSKAVDINAFVLGTWLLCFELNIELSLSRVSSKENLADAPSRGHPPLGASGPARENSLEFTWEKESVEVRDRP